MSLSFRHVAIMIALLFSALSLIWMFAPQHLLAEWGVASTSSAELIGRRAAALYAGLAAIFWCARDVPPSPLRAAMTKGLILTCLILSLLGIYELAAGHVTLGILIPVAIEGSVIFALLYVSRNQSSKKHIGSSRTEQAHKARQSTVNTKKKGK